MRNIGVCIFGIALMFLSTAAKNNNGIISLDLEPGALLYHQQHHSMKGHRRLESSPFQDIPFHPYNNGIYSSLVEIEIQAENKNETNEIMHSSLIEEHNKRVREFNSQRHLSRHELFRLQRQGNEADVERNENRKMESHRRLQEDVNLRGGLPPILAETNEQLSGGLYNDFQSAPLSQGYGTHYATVWVGTPTPQRKTLIVDTGSHHTAWPCKGCEDCGEDHHTDSYFNPDKSVSFNPLQCHECRYNAQCENLNTEGTDNKDNQINLESGCMMKQSYTEGSSWTAYQARDLVFCGGRDVFSAADPVAQRFAVEFVFNCQITSSGLFRSQLADGIMGLSQHEAALPRVMFDQGKIQNRLFSLCFRKEVVVSKKGVSAGVLTFGGIDRRLNSSPMVYAKNIARTGWYTVYVKNVYLQQSTGETANVIQIPSDRYEINSGKGVIIDSGTTDSFLHKSMKQPFNEIWKQLTGKAYSNSPLRLTRKQVLNLPTILIQIMAYDDEIDANLGAPDDVVGLVGSLDAESPNDILLSIPATHYLEYSPSKDVYTPRFYFTEDSGGVIGANSLQGHDVLFDWKNGRIGFAESDCKISKTSFDGEGLASEGSEARGQDCILQPSVITKSCHETVDASVCTDNNPEAILTGMDTVVSVVEYPGTTGGFDCEEVIRKTTLRSNIEDNSIDVNCNKSGLCAATQKCELSCGQFHDLQPISDQSAGNEETPSKQCGDGPWGTCLESCSQSKLKSILMSDGECHEVRDERLERPCHTEYCGISDPCKVPFVVHVILAFGGINNDSWNKETESSLIEAFASSVKDSKGNQLFVPTDVEVLMTSPWFQEEVDVNGSPAGDIAQAVGTRAVVEVHIHNPNAVQSVVDSEERIPLMFGRKHKASEKVSECKSSDLFELAQKAHEIHYVLNKDNFMTQLIHSLQIQSSENPGASSPVLVPLMTNQQFMDQSLVVSSWTIKTAIGGGSIYDHKLDPFPGAANYVSVSPAYLGHSPFTALSIVVLAVLAWNIFLRGKKDKRKDEDEKNLFTKLTATTFTPKPFEMVRRKLNVYGSKNRKTTRGSTESQTLEFYSEDDKEHFTGVKNMKCRSRLNDILSN